MKIEVNTIVEGNSRRPDYDGSFSLIEDRGETMVIRVDEKQYKEIVKDYNIIVQNLIAEKYTIEQELALHRQRETKVQEFQEYFDYCEECKQIAREIIDKSSN